MRNRYAVRGRRISTIAVGGKGRRVVHAETAFPVDFTGRRVQKSATESRAIRKTIVPQTSRIGFWTSGDTTARTRAIRILNSKHIHIYFCFLKKKQHGNSTEQ